MNRRTLCISSFLLAASLATPAALRATATPLTSRQPAYHQRDDRQQGRVYDPQHRDYHDWNDNEERSYRQFLSETHRDYREYGRLDERSQGDYWNWRHGHPDRDDRGGASPGRFYDDNGRDWHNWNDNEDRAYRQFLAENRRPYREFALIDPHEQQDYWVWRHSHPDRDDRGGAGPGRFYDDNGRDWHDWNDNEDRAYRQYLGENHHEYIEFSLLVPRDQQEFWVWRHSHPDGDNRANGQGHRYYDQNTGQYHDWNDNEDRAYRRFVEENHRQYVDFDHADQSFQLQFWLWRQFHPDGNDQPTYRYYEDDRRERHEWNEREEGSYRSFLISISRPYVEFSVASPDVQVRYWNWRHDHPDANDNGSRRYLDARRNQWHFWDDREERAYRQFMNERSWPYRELYILLPRDQQRYWDWRHSHPDRDRGRN